MSQTRDIKRPESASDDPAIRPTPKTGRHAILPGVGLAKPDVIVPLAIGPSSSEELPDLDLPGRLPEDNPRLIRRTEAPAQDTEKLLNAIIGECHFLMSEVAVRCIVQSPNVEDRLAFIRSATSIAETGANVARAVAKLRHAPPDEEAMVAKIISKWSRVKQEKKSES
ncbi:MAG TPA: hypothetical protein VII56_19520 [Rhizomicrobium sp.]